MKTECHQHGETVKDKGRSFYRRYRPNADNNLQTTRTTNFRRDLKSVTMETVSESLNVSQSDHDVKAIFLPRVGFRHSDTEPKYVVQSCVRDDDNKTTCRQ